MAGSNQVTTNLAQRLGSEQGAAVKEQLLADLARLELSLMKRLAAMVPRSEFPALAASLEATRAAQKVIGNRVA